VESQKLKSVHIDNRAANKNVIKFGDSLLHYMAQTGIGDLQTMKFL
jgi:hypothetical protein